MILAIVLVAFLSPHLTNIHGSMEKQHNNALLNLYMAFLYAQVRNHNCLSVDVIILVTYIAITRIHECNCVWLDKRGLCPNYSNQ